MDVTSETLSVYLTYILDPRVLFISLKAPSASSANFQYTASLGLGPLLYEVRRLH